MISMSNSVEGTEVLVLKEKYQESGMLTTQGCSFKNSYAQPDISPDAWGLGDLCTICVAETRSEPLLEPF